MEEYHKIETVFNREETGGHKLIRDSFRNKAVEQCKDLQWNFTEKIDGTNVRIHWDGHKIEFNGRTDNADLHKDLKKLIAEKFCSNEVEELIEQKIGGKELFIFAEGYGAGIQTGGGYSKDKGIIVYDVKINGYYLSYDDMVDFMKPFDVKCVPLVLTGTINEGIQWVLDNEFSRVGDGTQKCEGVVGRLVEEMFDRHGNRMIVKIKRCDFV